MPAQAEPCPTQQSVVRSRKWQEQCYGLAAQEEPELRSLIEFYMKLCYEVNWDGQKIFNRISNDLESSRSLPKSKREKLWQNNIVEVKEEISQGFVDHCLDPSSLNPGNSHDVSTSLEPRDTYCV